MQLLNNAGKQKNFFNLRHMDQTLTNLGGC